MFGRVLYCDSQAVNDYLSIATGQSLSQKKKGKTIKEAELNLSAIKIGYSQETESIAGDVDSLLLKCEQLEKVLKGRDDYVDAITDCTEVDLTTIPRGTIVKFDCSLHVPEQFTTTLLLDDFKKLIISEVDHNVEDERGKEVMKGIIESAKISTIPIELKTDDILMCSKLYAKNMIVNIQDFEDYEDEELTVLVRVVNNGMHEQSKPYYDPLKDYLLLNRAIRRNLKNPIKGMEKLCADSDYKPVEVIAIYQ